jgi:hypothetical protein
VNTISSITRDSRALRESLGWTSDDSRALQRLYRESDLAETQSPLASACLQDSQIESPDDCGSAVDQHGVGLSNSRGQGNEELDDRVEHERVHNNASKSQKLRVGGTVIPCPLEQQNGCSGRDENMASLE